MHGNLGSLIKKEQKGVLFPKDILFKRRIKKAMIAKKDAWLVFDMDNGDEEKKYYVWWFPTRAKAREHIKWQRNKPNSAELAGPFKFTRAK